MTPTTPKRTPFVKPDVPEGFPLSWHKYGGYWFKKRDGRVILYERDADASLARYNADLAAWAGKDVPADAPRKRYTLRDAVNLYLTRQKRKMESGDITDVQFAKDRGELEYWLPKAAPFTTSLESFRARGPADDGPAAIFHRIKSAAIARGLSAARRHIVTVRAVLDAASKGGGRLMLAPDYGDTFDPPSQGRINRQRHERDAKHGGRTWSVDELRKILAAAVRLRDERRAKGRKNRVPRNHHLYAQILLGLFAACGSDDLSAMPERAIDFKTGWIKHLRKKEDNRECAAVLPRVVLDAVKHSIDHRAPRKDGAKHLLFVTTDGNPCNVAPRKFDEHGIVRRVGRNDTIGQNFKRLVKRINLQKHRAGFKTLRSCCRTQLVTGNVHEDIVAVIMGRPFRYPVDDYYIRGELRAEMVRASKHLQKVLIKRTGELR